jgi:hypothetical protein
MEDIGECAGKVWRVLSKSGKAPLSAVMKQTGLTRAQTQLAVGWLARENKISLQENGKKQVLHLNRNESH